MAKSTGIILTAGALTIGNEFVQKPGSIGTLFRPAMAFLGIALVFSGLEKLDEDAAVGLAVIVMITVLFGGVNHAYKSPAAEVLSLIGAKS
jgi:energy-converting hydrogenase Eha subunit B